jgi:hypothetical protein
MKKLTPPPAIVALISESNSKNNHMSITVKNHQKRTFVSADGQVQMAGSDTLHLQVLGRVSGQLQNFGSQVLETKNQINYLNSSKILHGSGVDSGSGSDTSVRSGALLQETMDSTDWELQTSTLTSRDHFALGFAAVLARFSFASGHFELRFLRVVVKLAEIELIVKTE